MEKGVEFFVDTITSGRNGERNFVGYVNAGGSVSLWDMFRVAYFIPRTVEDVRMGRPLSAPINVRSVSLEVASIEVMRRSLQQLNHGITAIVRLVGEGGDLIVEGDRLGTGEP